MKFLASLLDMTKSSQKNCEYFDATVLSQYSHYTPNSGWHWLPQGHGLSWWRKCRFISTFLLNKQPKFVGTEQHPIEFDESYCSVRRKYNRGRLLNRDKFTDDDVGDEMSELEDWDSAGKRSIYYYDGEVFNQDVKDWLWVVGMYNSYKNARSVRVKNRTERTFKYFLDKHIAHGSVVWTDKSTGYSAYAMYNYIHETANHKENYVDPVTKSMTQSMEHTWLDSKSWSKKSRGNRVYLQEHLDEIAWRRLRSLKKRNGALFQAFLEDMPLTKVRLE